MNSAKEELNRWADFSGDKESVEKKLNKIQVIVWQIGAIGRFETFFEQVVPLFVQETNVTVYVSLLNYVIYNRKYITGSKSIQDSR